VFTNDGKISVSRSDNKISYENIKFYCISDTNCSSIFLLLTKFAYNDSSNFLSISYLNILMNSSTADSWIVSNTYMSFCLILYEKTLLLNVCLYESKYSIILSIVFLVNTFFVSCSFRVCNTDSTISFKLIL
jgi:hypothetical protein